MAKIAIYKNFGTQLYYLAHSMTEMCIIRLNGDVKWEGVPVDYDAGKEFVLVIVFEC